MIDELVQTDEYERFQQMFLVKGRKKERMGGNGEESRQHLSDQRRDVTFSS